MNEVLESNWREAVVVCHRILLEQLKKTTGNFSYGNIYSLIH
jgi:hypothetical protein